MHPIQTLQAESDRPESPTQPAPVLSPTLRRIVLTGFMGAGKSTVGRLLAARLNWEFLDLDAHLESRASLSVPEIFALHGEAHFRRLESSALVNALSRTHTILALGGGTPEILTNRLLLEQTPGTTTVFLNAPFPTLFDRCVLQEIGRPLLADPVLAQARFEERQPLYRRLARHTIDTAAQSPQETAEALLTTLRPPHLSQPQAATKPGAPSSRQLDRR